MVYKIFYSHDRLISRYSSEESGVITSATQVIEIEEINKNYELAKAVKASIEILQTNERFVQFVEERNKLMNDIKTITNYDWNADFIPSAERALTEYANLLPWIPYIHQKMVV